MVPGSYSGLSTNIYQEGVRIPPIKILERGNVNRAAMALLMANMRVPDARERLATLMGFLAAIFFKTLE